MKTMSAVFGLATMSLMFAFTWGINHRPPPDERSADKVSLKEDYDKRHENTAKTPLLLSHDIMSRLYKMQVGDKGGLATMEIMYRLDDLRGVPRLQTLMMFEKMDTNSDGTINADEFQQMYGPAASSPNRAFKAIFKLYDYDNNGSISVWELLRYQATLIGFDFNLVEMAKMVEQKYRAMDANGDMKVTEDEFVVFLTFMATSSIGKVKKGSTT